jgi:hypothetical protein
VAIEFAYQLQCSYDEGTLSHMFKNTFGNFFNTSRLSQGATAAGAPGGAVVPSSGAGANPSAGAAGGALARQASGPAATSRPETKTDVAAPANRRRSFGAGGTASTGTSSQAGSGGGAGPVGGAGADNTPQRPGVFSYFMRSPQGTNSAAEPGGAHTTPAAGKHPTNTAKGAQHKAGAHATPLTPGGLGVKSTELDTYIDFEGLLDEGASSTTKARPTRKFIYGDDSNSDASSTHGSSELLSAMSGERSPVPGRISPKPRSASADAIVSADPSPIRGADGSQGTGDLLELDDSELASPMSPAPVAVAPTAASTLSSRFGEAMSSFYSGGSQKTSPNPNTGTAATPSPAPVSMASGPEKSPPARVNSTDSSDSLGGYFFGSPAKLKRDAPEELPPPPTAPAQGNKAPPLPPTAATTGAGKTGSTGAVVKTASFNSTASTATTASTSASAAPAGAKKPPTGAPTAAAHNAAEDVFPRGRIREAPTSAASSPSKAAFGRTSSASNTTTGMTYTPNPNAAELIAHSDKKLGLATTKAEILYRFPPTVAPPPQEVSDFCLPLGGKISKLSDFDSGTTVQEILFGHSHSKRSSRCFIFLLEDKTLAEDAGDEETGVGANRLYGICVLHPRLIKTPIQNTKRKNPLAPNQPHTSTMDASAHPAASGMHGTAAGSVAESEYIEFESMVCYAFITRFPLFDFFFQVIFDLINTERLMRMELAAEHSDSDLLYSRSVYQYLPTSVLGELRGGCAVFAFVAAFLKRFAQHRA